MLNTTSGVSGSVLQGHTQLHRHQSTSAFHTQAKPLTNSSFATWTNETQEKEE